MKIKQQKQIKTFLIEEFGNEKGNELFEKQAKLLNEIIQSTKHKSKSQMKTLTQTILPRIALYKVFLKEELSEETSYEYIRKYMLNKIAAPKHAQMKKMEKVPGY